LGEQATSSNQEFLKLWAVFPGRFSGVGGLTVFLRPQAVRFESKRGAAISKQLTEKALCKARLA
jgi:hypothetical protein